MKNVVASLVMVLLCIATYGQTTIENCKGNTQKRVDLLEKAAVFNAIGVNLNKYDWSDPTVNCHINSTILNLKKGKTLNVLGSVGMGLSGGMLVNGSLSQYKGAKNGFIAGGLILLGGSIYSFVRAKQKKKKSNRHLNQVMNYYQRNNLL